MNILGNSFISHVTTELRRLVSLCFVGAKRAAAYIK